MKATHLQLFREEQRSVEEMSGPTRRRSARVAKQPTAPVDRIPEMKEMSLEQQLEFDMVWRGTEGDRSDWHR